MPIRFQLDVPPGHSAPLQRAAEGGDEALHLLRAPGEGLARLAHHAALGPQEDVHARLRLSRKSTAFSVRFAVEEVFSYC